MTSNGLHSVSIEVVLNFAAYNEIEANGSVINSGDALFLDPNLNAADAVSKLLQTVRREGAKPDETRALMPAYAQKVAIAMTCWSMGRIYIRLGPGANVSANAVALEDTIFSVKEYRAIENQLTYMDIVDVLGRSKLADAKI